MSIPSANIILKNAGYPSGRRPIVLSISYKGAREFIPIPRLTAHPEMWDQYQKRCTADDPDADIINRVIAEYETHANDLITMLEANRQLEQLPEITKTAAEIKYMILKKKQPGKADKLVGDDICFFEYAKREMDLLHKRHQYGLHARYHSAVNKFKDWCNPKKISDYRLMISEMKGKDIADYHADHLLGKLGNHKTTAHVSVRILKTIYNKAVETHPFLKQYDNPFATKEVREIKIPKESKKKIHALSFDDIKLLADVKVLPGMARSRDVFLFCYECMGIRIGDAIRLKWSQIHNDNISFNAGKTDKLLQAEVTPYMKKILKKYKDNPDYVFGFLKAGMSAEVIDREVKKWTAYINKELKKIAGIANLQSLPHGMIHSHLARHTLANHVYAQTMNIQLVKEICQHSDIRITENYIGRLGFKDVLVLMREYRTQRKRKGMTL